MRKSLIVDSVSVRNISMRCQSIKVKSPNQSSRFTYTSSNHRSFTVTTSSQHIIHPSQHRLQTLPSRSLTSSTHGFTDMPIIALLQNTTSHISVNKRAHGFPRAAPLHDYGFSLRGDFFRICNNLFSGPYRKRCGL